MKAINVLFFFPITVFLLCTGMFVYSKEPNGPAQYPSGQYLEKLEPSEEEKIKNFIVYCDSRAEYFKQLKESFSYANNMNREAYYYYSFMTDCYTRLGDELKFFLLCH